MAGAELLAAACGRRISLNARRPPKCASCSTRRRPPGGTSDVASGGSIRNSLLGRLDAPVAGPRVRHLERLLVTQRQPGHGLDAPLYLLNDRVRAARDGGAVARAAAAGVGGGGARAGKRCFIRRVREGGRACGRRRQRRREGGASTGRPAGRRPAAALACATALPAGSPVSSTHASLVGTSLGSACGFKGCRRTRARVKVLREGAGAVERRRGRAPARLHTDAE